MASVSVTGSASSLMKLSILFKLGVLSKDHRDLGKSRDR